MDHPATMEERSFIGIPKVKICGITNLHDAELAIEAGADALGFVLYAKSPRCITPDALQRIIAKLPPFILSIGVFVNEDIHIVRTLMDRCGLFLAQLHGDESPEYCAALERPVLRAIRLRDSRSFLALAELRGRTAIRGFVIDAFSESAYGGTGKTADWALAAEAAKAAPTLLAGGLTPTNVQEAIRRVQPYGVDVSSGVERAPGQKDPHKLKAFIRAAKLVT